MGAGIVSGSAVVAHYPQHVLAVFLITRKRAKFFSHLGRRGVSNTCEDRRYRSCNRLGFIRIIRRTGDHEYRAEIGITQSEGAVFVTLLCDGPTRELRHHH